jgi:hypothetical protein
MKVQILVDKDPFYSGYAGLPIVVIPAGSVGVVGGYRGCGDMLIDFTLPGVWMNFIGQPERQRAGIDDVWRVSVLKAEIKKQVKFLGE